MNIFYLDHNKKKAAESHLDKHIVKMPLETSQIICTACHLNDIPLDIPYKPTHKSHPCVQWAAESSANLRWLIDFGEELCREYTHRYEKVHACEEKVIRWAQNEMIWQYLEDGDIRTDPPLAMPDEYKTEDTVESYRLYYVMEKDDIAEWTNRNSPEWWSKWD